MFITNLMTILEPLIIYSLTTLVTINSPKVFVTIIMAIYLYTLVIFCFKVKKNFLNHLITYYHLTTWLRFLFINIMVIIVRLPDIENDSIKLVSIVFCIIELMTYVICLICQKKINSKKMIEVLSPQKQCVLILPYLYTNTKSLGFIVDTMFLFFGIMVVIISFYNNRDRLRRITINIIILIVIFILHRYVQGITLFIFSLYNIYLFNNDYVILVDNE